MTIAAVSSSTLHLVSNVLAVLAVIAEIAVAAGILLWLAGRVFAPARRLWNGVRFTLRGTELWIAFGVALTAMLGSLFFSNIVGFPPCRLCWLQRFCMYPLVPILLVLALRSNWQGWRFKGLPLALSVIGSCVSIFHLYIEAHPEVEAKGCVLGGSVSCSAKWIEVFGYLTIPALALSAFLLISGLILLAGTALPAPADAPTEDQ